MKKRMKRLTAVLTATCLVGMCLSPGMSFSVKDSWAAETEGESDLQVVEGVVTSEEDSVTDSESILPDADSQKEESNAQSAGSEEQEDGLTAGDSGQSVEGTVQAVPDDSESSEDDAQSADSEETAEDASETSEDDSEEVIEKISSEINYMIVESPYLETPDTERMIVCYGDGTEQVENAALYVTDEDGETELWNLSEYTDGFLIFEKYFADEGDSGVYEAVRLTVTDEDGEHAFVFAEYDMTVQFGVNEEYSGLDELEDLTGESETSSDEDALGATVVEIDQNSDSAVEDIVEALESAEEETGTDVSSSGTDTDTLAAAGTAFGLLSSILGTVTADAAESDNIVVALDPGHDSTHAGASANGLKEEELTLKIAQYCKEELETYEGVTVYMTRTAAACPYPSSTSSGNDIKQRVAAAVEAGASIYVSIHLNSNTVSSAKGAEVIIPNTNYNSEVAAEAEELAEAILTELKSAGVTLRSTSIYSRTASEDTYDDGSLADYFAVQRYAKLQGIPGIIVEHCFISNSSDVSNFLSTDSGLKKLGEADATGIATYLGLSKSTWSAPVLKSAAASATGTTVSWSSVSGATGYMVYRKTASGSWSRLGTTTSTSYTDTASLTNGTTYYYTVRAYKGTQSTALANTYSSSYWTSYNTTGVKCVYTKTPALSSSVINTASGIQISWSAVSGVTGYAVYRKTSGGSWSMINTTTSTSYTDTSASAGTTYIYTVRAYRGTLSTAKSNKYSAAYWSGYDSTGVSGIFTKTPTLNTATAEAAGTKISWSSVSGATGYAVYRKVSGGSWSMIDTTTSTSYTDTSSLTGGKTYYYTVRAYRGNLTTAKANKYSSTYWSYFNTTGAKAVYLAIPTLSSASYSSSGIKVSWKSVTGASGYAVYRKPSGGSWSMITTTTSTSYTDTASLTSGSTYYYTVRAYTGSASTAKSNRYNAAYWSGFNSTGVVYDVPLATPSLNTATADAAGTKISWGSVSGASGYAVYRKLSGGSWSMIATTTSTSYTDTASLTGGKTYYYTVRAYKGSSSTAMSNKYSSTYWSSYDSTGVGSVYLAVPALSSEQTAAGGITVNWKSVTGASGYAIYRKISGGSWAMLDTTTSTSYTDTTVSTGATYYYTVRAYTGSASTAKSNRYNALYWSGYTDSGIEGYYLSTPSLSGTSVVNDGIQVSWTAVSNGVGYAVYRKTSGGSWSMIGTTTSTSYTDTNGGSAGTAYYYTVRAYKGTESTAKANKYSSVYWSHYDTAGVTGSAYSIEGSSTVTVAQMVAMYKAKSPIDYPSEALSEGGASTIEELAQIYYEEAKAEGIRVEVAWCQAMYETGYLKFGGSVDISQYNFAGIGATDGSTAGANFSTVREGVRAQIQHLKAYASSAITEDTLANDLVDPRFTLVTKGSAKYVEILGIQENPLGYGWAGSAGYGTAIVSLIKQLKSY